MANNNRDDQTFMIKVSETIPSLQECTKFVISPECGAVSSFIGVTRKTFQGKIVSRLSYEGYVPMAEKEIRKLCVEAVHKKFPSIHRIAAVHILGDCPVGETSVILCASSPHRREAIRCIEFLIDELKARVPIWKREIYEGEEGSVWKENMEWHEGKSKRVMIKENS